MQSGLALAQAAGGFGGGHPGRAIRTPSAPFMGRLRISRPVSRNRKFFSLKFLQECFDFMERLAILSLALSMGLIDLFKDRSQNAKDETMQNNSLEIIYRKGCD
ncbi:MAG: hypothetical protein EKK29_17745 [Hyphomicrobiales bacterium]|nr:MAG: hypothetical protein EKK29_17745 [Hyphomicrobiales bacterium]